MSKLFVINGRFMEDPMHGLARYSRELIDELDGIIDYSLSIVLLIPPTAKDVPEYSHIKIEKTGKCGGIIWEQTYLRSYIRKDKSRECINLCNVAPLFVQPGITAILDIMYKVNPSHYTTIRNRLSRAWHMFQYFYITSHEKNIITISNFCKGEIEAYYPRSKGKITVIPCAWQHVLNYKCSSSWLKKYPFLEDNKYFFSLATLSKNKNGKWIIEIAKNNPNYIFAIAGRHYETEYDTVPDNVHLLGYVSDEDACSLIKHCQAFLFPSLYEGFGLPPLEALALGAKVISSNTTSLPEVLGTSAYYINPLNYTYNMDEILCEIDGHNKTALNKYSWKDSAYKLYELLNKAGSRY